jgi:hypothetical protein
MKDLTSGKSLNGGHNGTNIVVSSIIIIVLANFYSEHWGARNGDI